MGCLNGSRVTSHRCAYFSFVPRLLTPSSVVTPARRPNLAPCTPPPVVTQTLALRKDQAKSTKAEIEEAEKSQRHPFPTELSLWTVDDVCRWLDTLQLGEYKDAFREGKVGAGGETGRAWFIHVCMPYPTLKSAHVTTSGKKGKFQDHARQVRV